MAVSVFVPSVAEGFEWAVPADDRDFETLRRLGQFPLADVWTPMRVELLMVDDHGKRLNRADLPWTGSHVLVLRREAAESLRYLLETVGELLPLSCSDADLVLFHSTVTLDALDEDRSQVVRFSSGRIMRVDQPEFQPEAVTDALVFRVPQMMRGSLYATGKFVHAYEELGLSGTKFTRVWPSQTEPQVPI